MPDDLRRFTVSAVVNTDTGELVGTPIVRPGHEDYDTFHTVNPLAANEQFRWVHVWAPNPDVAGAADALTTDLRPGGDRNRPLARALAGNGGLKLYTVNAVVSGRNGLPLGEVSVVEGHTPVGKANWPLPLGSRDLLEQVWALDPADAVEQVFGAYPDGRRPARPHAASSAHGDPADRGETAGHDALVAQREWNRLAGMPAAARAALVADTVWNREYQSAYRTAYTAAAIRIAAAASEAAEANPGAWLTLHQLATAAGQTISQLAPEHPAAPPADQHTVAAAQAAAAKPGPQPRWRRIADLAKAGARTAGTLAGTLTAATDILTDWRGYSGHAIAEGVTVYGQPARAWVGDLLARVNREIASPVAPAPTRTSAQLAGEDQASGVSPRAAGATSRRARTATSAAPTSTTTRRTP